MFQRPGPGPYYEAHHGGHPWLAFLMLLVVLAAVAVAAAALWRAYHPAPPPVVAKTAAAAPARDPALAELRLRYARGEIDRDEYLQRATDLGDTIVAAPPPKSPPGDA